MEQSTGKIQGALKLNDSSHFRTDRYERDLFLERVFASCGIPLLWVSVSKYYENNQEIAEYIDKITAK